MVWVRKIRHSSDSIDLSSFCLTLQRELQLCIVRLSQRFAANFNPRRSNFAPSEFCYSSLNQPFALGDRRTAEDMRRMDIETRRRDKIRKTLLCSLETRVCS